MASAGADGGGDGGLRWTAGLPEYRQHGPSIVSVTTSFLAVYLTFRRSAFFALAYAANDVVLIVLWVLAARTEPRYLSMVACFAAFLVNDLYGFWSWRKMHARQKQRRPEP